jgi:hypothetical protein
MVPKKVPVSQQALMHRVNRRLKKAEEVLRKSHGLRMLATLGGYYVVDTSKKIICRYHVDLETEARRIGALSAWEKLADE